MSKRIVTDRYSVTVPGDCADTVEELGDIAISEARERSRLYCTPAEWSAVLTGGEQGTGSVPSVSPGGATVDYFPSFENLGNNP